MSNQLLRHFKFRIDWHMNEEWQPRMVWASVPASDCATVEDRDLAIGLLGAGFEAFYGCVSEEGDGFQATLLGEATEAGGEVSKIDEDGLS